MNQFIDTLQEELVTRRRDFHHYAETGWLEIRTASLIARELTNLGYEVLIGKDVCKTESRMGLPDQEVLDANYERALAQGADVEFAKLVKDGYTGVIGILRLGEGPVTAMRFDIDALGVIEDTSPDHFPYANGFASCNEGSMHACGHDGHATIGLGVAKTLMRFKDQLQGTIKLIFQPAEEGVRGAKSIVDKGHLDDVDYFFGCHIASNKDQGKGDGLFIPGAGGTLATTKLDVYLKGLAAHAGGSPELGHNVMLAIATIISNLYSIPRHSQGATRINVGTVQAGTGRNVIADQGKMEIEVRGSTTEVNDYVEAYARKIIDHACKMHEIDYEIKVMGSTGSLESDEALMKRVQKVINETLPEIGATQYLKLQMGGSEDVAYMMNQVQSHGGQATFMQAMTKVDAPFHARKFNFDESVLINGVKVYCQLVYDTNKKI